MKIGFTFPNNEIGTDPIVMRDLVQGMEDLGVDHMIAYDHVVGVDRTMRPEWGMEKPPPERMALEKDIGPYAYRHMFHEPLTLFSLLSLVTTKIELTSGIVI